MLLGGFGTESFFRCVEVGDNFLDIILLYCSYDC